MNTRLGLVRDTAIWVVALLLIIYEAIGYEGPTRYGLLTLYATMLGVPLVIRADQRRERENGTPEPPPEPREANK